MIFPSLPKSNINKFFDFFIFLIIYLLLIFFKSLRFWLIAIGIFLITTFVIVLFVLAVIFKWKRTEYNLTKTMETLNTNHHPDVEQAYEDTVMSCLSQQSQSKMNRPNAPTKIYNPNEIETLIETKNETKS